MDATRIAVVGAGMIGRRHIEEIRYNRSCALASVVDTTEASARLAREAGVARYPSLQAMLAADRPDGVILATPNALHVEQALECVRAAVPTLVEKPVAHSVAEGLRLCDAAEAAGVPILVGHHRRHSPILHRAVEVVRSGALGRLVAVIGSAAFCKPADYFEGPNAWRRQPGGGPILINMIHEIANLRAMVGEIVAVQAFTSSGTRGHAVEDTAAVTLRFANGALGTFLLSDTAACPKSWEQTSRENADYATCPDEDAYVLIGTNGSLGVPTMRLRRYARDEDRSWFRPFVEQTLPLERRDPLAEQIEHFRAVIRREAEPLVTARDGLRNLQVTEAIVAAATTGCAVGTI